MDRAPTGPRPDYRPAGAGATADEKLLRGRDGKIAEQSFDDAKNFLSEVREFHGIDGLAELLRELRRARRCVIRGAPGRWHPVQGGRYCGGCTPRWSSPTPAATSTAAKKPPPATARMRTSLPGGCRRLPCCRCSRSRRPTGCCSTFALFRPQQVSTGAPIWRGRHPCCGCSCLPSSAMLDACFYATASAADPDREDLGGDIIKMRLGFVLDRGVVFAEAKRWLAARPNRSSAPCGRSGHLHGCTPVPRRAGRPARRQASGYARRRPRAGRGPAAGSRATRRGSAEPTPATVRCSGPRDWACCRPPGSTPPWSGWPAPAACDRRRRVGAAPRGVRLRQGTLAVTTSTSRPWPTRLAAAAAPLPQCGRDRRIRA